MSMELQRVMMRPRWVSNAFAFIAALLTVIAGMRTVIAADIETDAVRFALLVGVGKYPNLSNAEQLDGSTNDVLAMRQLLVERLGFSSQNVTTLMDEQATGAGIRQGLRGLIEKVRQQPANAPSAQVIVHFSGHGSQVADQPDGPDHDEDDGLDETWVPHDATKQGGSEDIRDDELNILVRELCQDGKAQVLIIADCCHSGTGARGTGKVRKLQRSVTPTQPSTNAPLTRKLLPEGAVFLSACRDREVEPEFQKDDKSYGLLTWFLVASLSEECKLSRLSYDLLQKAIVGNYQRDRGVMQAPVPQLEGNSASLRSTILGFGSDVDRSPYFEVDSGASPSRVLLRGGKFHHVTVGSLFELYERPEQIASSSDKDNASLSWLRITKVDGTTSEAEVIRREDDTRGSSTEAKLPESFKKGLAVLRQQQLGDSTLRLKVVNVSGDGGNDSRPLVPGDATLSKAISESLAAAQKKGETKWLNWITQPDEPCDLVLRIDGDYAALFPSTGIPELVASESNLRGAVPASLRGGWGPFDVRTAMDPSDPPQSVIDYVRRITRARNLINLAQIGTPHGISNFEVGLELMNGNYDEVAKKFYSAEPWQSDADRLLSMREKDVYAFRVTNRQKAGAPIYVTLLAISPSMGIEIIMPYEEPLLKLEAGEDRFSDPFECTAPHGLNQAILLVTREPAEFRFVAQPDLPKTRGASAQGAAASLTEQLTEITHFQPPTTRGQRIRRKESDTTWHAEVISWRTAR